MWRRCRVEGARWKDKEEREEQEEEGRKTRGRREEVQHQRQGESETSLAVSHLERVQQLEHKRVFYLLLLDHAHRLREIGWQHLEFRTKLDPTMPYPHIINLFNRELCPIPGKNVGILSLLQ